MSQAEPSHSLYRLAKPVLDRLFAVIALLIFALPMLLVALVVAWRLGRPVLFSQQRIGKGGRLFTLYKFRSMLPEQYEGHSDAERLTGFGRWLRRTSLDELPQLWHLLTGELSLVGPRPLLPEYLPLYSPEQARRHQITPGITGWAQVNGRNALSWDEKFKHDLHYVDNLSLALDLKIIWLTLLTLLRPNGITQPGQATMEKFKGTQRSFEQSGQGEGK